MVTVEAQEVQDFKERVQAIKTEIEQARAQYIIARAEQETTEQIDQESKKAVLNQHEFKNEENGTRILRPIEDYNMNDQDFKKYSKLVHAERTKRGLKITGYTGKDNKKNPPWNTTSDYKTRPALKQAENAIIKLALETLNPKMKKDLKNIEIYPKQRKKLIDLFMRLNINEARTCTN